MARIGRYVIFLSVYTIGLAVTGGIFSYLLLWLFIIVSVPLHLLMPNVVSKMSMPHVPWHLPFISPFQP
jgi:hypothetical protein